MTRAGTTCAVRTRLLDPCARTSPTHHVIYTRGTRATGGARNVAIWIFRHKPETTGTSRHSQSTGTIAHARHRAGHKSDSARTNVHLDEIADEWIGAHVARARTIETFGGGDGDILRADAHQLSRGGRSAGATRVSLGASLPLDGRHRSVSILHGTAHHRLRVGASVCRAARSASPKALLSGPFVPIAPGALCNAVQRQACTGTQDTVTAARYNNCNNNNNTRAATFFFPHPVTVVHSSIGAENSPLCVCTYEFVFGAVYGEKFAIRTPSFSPHDVNVSDRWKRLRRLVRENRFSTHQTVTVRL